MMIATKQYSKSAEDKTAKKEFTRQEKLKTLLRRPTGVTIALVHKSLGSQPYIPRVAFSTLPKTGNAIERLETAKAPVHRIAREA